MNQIIYPLGGGVLIAIASTILLGGLGRILGVSGILGSFLRANQKRESVESILVIRAILWWVFHEVNVSRIF